jgi:hypothetical protein
MLAISFPVSDAFRLRLLSDGLLYLFSSFVGIAERRE